MNVTGTDSTQQMQMQMRKMDGTGGGKGQGGGMKDIMQSLSAEDQTTLKNELQSMSMEDRMAKVSEMKEVDSSKMTDDEYVQTLLDILNQDDTNQAEEEGFSVYV